jgi:antitoxin YefM
MTTITYSRAREKLAEIWDELEESREEIILRRRGHEDVAMLPAHELRRLKETAHLLRVMRRGC